MPLWTSRWPTTNTLMVVLKTAQMVLQHVPQGPLQASFEAGWHSPVAPYLLFPLFSGQSADMMDGTGASISDHKVPMSHMADLPDPSNPESRGISWSHICPGLATSRCLYDEKGNFHLIYATVVLCIHSRQAWPRYTQGTVRICKRFLCIFMFPSWVTWLSSTPIASAGKGDRASGNWQDGEKFPPVAQEPCGEKKGEHGLWDPCILPPHSRSKPQRARIHWRREGKPQAKR